MTKKITSTFNEETGEFGFDLNGYNGDDCEDEWERIKKVAAAMGLDLGEINHFKKPRIPNVGARKNKIGGGK